MQNAHKGRNVTAAHQMCGLECRARMEPKQLVQQRQKGEEARQRRQLQQHQAPRLAKLLAGRLHNKQLQDCSNMLPGVFAGLCLRVWTQVCMCILSGDTEKHGLPVTCCCLLHASLLKAYI